MSDVYDSENTSDQDNDAFQGMYTNAQNQNETIWEKKPNIYVEDGLPKKNPTASWRRYSWICQARYISNIDQENDSEDTAVDDSAPGD